MVRCGPCPCIDNHPFEKAEIIEAPLCAVHQDPVIGVAFGNIELPANDIVACASISPNLDTLNVSARAFINEECQVDRTVFEVPVALRGNFTKSETVFSNGFRHGNQCFLDFSGTVGIAGLNLQRVLKNCRVDR